MLLEGALYPPLPFVPAAGLRWRFRKCIHPKRRIPIIAIAPTTVSPIMATFGGPELDLPPSVGFGDATVSVAVAGVDGRMWLVENEDTVEGDPVTIVDSGLDVETLVDATGDWITLDSVDVSREELVVLEPGADAAGA
jgi:hypothetical protein